ncbi:hypothetical protein N825_03035 [Skermanella stibiiresistens SB22]|uniref:DUF2066 domain-containing protein n=1 Tax=Skermanella stibiiresistens SB22 TaxID=1385369 RepID=W9H5K3_9PROT|nr:DUF2066 domain-containing protein [Skermanella stibiiresistens]EWY39982.1 hypothetical protein N825_03035 [Skermanella stibiiresistens SB22]
MLHRRPLACLFQLAVGIVLLAFSSPLRAQEASDIYTVKDVEIDVTADNAAAARDRAITEAQRKAFGTLYGRLSPDQAGRPPELSDIEVARLVQDFEVQRERSSAVRYLATLTVRFRPANVRTLLQNKGASYVEVRSKPVLVLPVYQPTGGGPILWEDRTAWRAAWENFPPPQGMVPIVVPYGELSDIADVSAANAIDGSASGFTSIAERYQAGDVLVAVLGVRGAEPDPSQPNTVKLTRYGAEGGRRTDSVTIPAAPGQSVDAYLAGGVAAVIRNLEDKWRQANTVAAGPEQVMQVAVPIARLEDWVQTKRRLAQVPTVSRTDLLSLTRGAARVELAYRGSPDVLRNALAQQDLELTEAAPLDQGAIQAGLPATPGTVAAPVAVMGPAGQQLGVYQPGPIWQLRWNGSRATGSAGRSTP